MFNSGSSFGSFGNNSNNTQQNTSPFGGFGGTQNQSSGTGLFGQTNNNTMSGSTGLFGQSSNSSTIGNGGLFGSSSNTNQTSGFGGSFGSTQGNATNTSPFGQSNTSGTNGTGGLFGKPANSSSTFGGFGGMNTGSNTFGGGSSSSFGPSSSNQTDCPGTAIAPFQPFTEKDTVKPGVTNSFEVITVMPRYSSWSLEELRFADYKQNRRYGTGSGGISSSPFGQSQSSPFGSTNTNSAFGANNATSPFGGNTSSTTTSGGLFGSSTTGSGFGQANNQSSPFGSTNNQTSSFGKPSTGLFGSSTNNSNTSSTSPFGGSTNAGFGSSSTSPFGTNSNSNQTSGFGGFGQKSSNNLGSAFGSGGFGSNTNGTSPNNTSPFGQPAQQPSSTGLFGNSSNASNTGGSLFGSNSNTSSPFGQPQNNNNNQTGFSFGSANNSNNANKNSLFSFGSTSNSSPFGQNNTSNSGSTGLFGQTTTSGASSTPFGQTAGSNNNTGFGSNNTQSSFSFGQNNNVAATNNNNNNGGSLFGQSTNFNSPGNNKPLFGGFGSSSTTSTATGTSVTSNGLTLGASKPAGTSLFGNNSNSSQNSQAGSLFGGTANKLTTPSTGLFGSKPVGSFGANNSSTTGGSLFGSGSIQQQPQQQQQQSSLFGNTQASHTSSTVPSLFGQTLSNSQTGLNPMVASIDQNPYGSNMLFQSVNGQSNAYISPQATPLVQGPLSPNVSTMTAKKKNSLFNATKLAPKPLFTPSRPLPSNRILSSGPVGSPSPQRRVSSLSSTSVGSETSVEDVKVVDMSRSPRVSSSGGLFSNSADESILASEAFSPRQSMRSLIIDRMSGYEDGIATPRSTSPLCLTPSAHNNNDGANDQQDPQVPSTPTPASSQNDANVSVLHASKPTETPVTSNSKNEESISKESSSITSSPKKSIKTDPPPKDEDIVDENGYWISPSNEKLAHMSLKELESVKNFKVGRKGVGIVQFEAPVDLSEFSDVFRQVPARLVVLNNKSCAFYPNLSHPKPSPGKGFNVPKVVTLHNIFTYTRDTKKPIQDSNHPMYIKHLNRLKSIPNTEFISWDKNSGDWTFRSLPDSRVPENNKSS